MAELAGQVGLFDMDFTKMYPAHCPPTGGADFQAVLTSLIRIADPNAPDVPMPKRWAHSGYLYDELGRWSVAWRITDAQHWGVPQRRKRLAVLVDFDGLTAGRLMFDPKYERKTERSNADKAVADTGAGDRCTLSAIEHGLPRNSDESGEQGQTVTACAAAGTGGTSYTLRMRGGVDRDANGRSAGKGALIQTELSGTISGSQDQTLFCGINGDIAGTLDASYWKGCGMRSGVEREVVCIEGNGARASHHGSGVSDDGVSFTLNTVDRHAVAVSEPLCIEMTSTKNTVISDGISPTLTARMGTGGNQVNCVMDKAVGIDRAAYNQGVNAQYKPQFDEELSPTLVAKGPNAVGLHSVVRRLTPKECLRLQGFPDDWFSLPDKTDMTDDEATEWERIRQTAAEVEGKAYRPMKSKEALIKWYNRMIRAESHQYKACGNSVATPFWAWLCKRISAEYERPATLGSLFDGIGGFPLVWERINGAGTALWASEVAEYPIAVTKYHFGD